MLNYIEPLFRPPSEARSLILQVTNGCSWNNCTFCEMYTAPQKKFRPKAQEDLEKELQALAATGYAFERVFLADGDAMALSMRRLVEILEGIRRYLPSVRRVSAYCLPRNVKKKSVTDLEQLVSLGLKQIYVGCETGDDQLLDWIEKGETFETSLSALTKAKAAGMKTSVMILNGLGGQNYWEQHAVNSALLMNEGQPNFLSTLVVTFPGGPARFAEPFPEDKGFVELDLPGLFQEMELMLDTLELEKTIFRSNHASNYLTLAGVLGKDKDKLLTQIRGALIAPERANLRPEWARGL
ncbi:radical SAM protein [Rhodovibrionaceae bacterium A322]